MAYPTLEQFEQARRELRRADNTELEQKKPKSNE